MDFYTRDIERGWIIHNSTEDRTVVACFSKGKFQRLIDQEKKDAEDDGFSTVKWKALAFHNDFLFGYKGNQCYLLFLWDSRDDTFLPLNKIATKFANVNLKYACLSPQSPPSSPQSLPSTRTSRERPTSRNPKPTCLNAVQEKDGLFRTVERNLAFRESEYKYEVIGKFVDNEVIPELTPEDEDFARSMGFSINVQSQPVSSDEKTSDYPISVHLSCISSHFGNATCCNCDKKPATVYQLESKDWCRDCYGNELLGRAIRESVQLILKKVGDINFDKTTQVKDYF